MSNISDIHDKILAEIEAEIPQYLNAFAQTVSTEIKNTSAFKGNILKNSLTSQVNGNTLTLTMPKIAGYLNFGTKPHIIRPKNKKMLYWIGSDGPVFASYVRHPGNPATHFFDDATEVANQKTQTLITNRIATLLSKS